MSPPTFDSFSSEVRKLLEEAAQNKGYNDTTADGHNELYHFVSTITNGSNHALGEIIYKVVRYSKKKDKTDLLKIAAWAFLIWRFDENRKD